MELQQEKKINPTCSFHQINWALSYNICHFLSVVIHTHTRTHLHINVTKRPAHTRLLSRIRQLITHSPWHPRKKCIFHWLCLCGAVPGRWLSSHRNVCNISQVFNHFKGQSDKVINGPSGDVQGATEAMKQALERWLNSV